MMNLKKYLLLAAFCILASNIGLYAQASYRIIGSTGVNMKLSGTSTLQKWAMNTGTFTGNAQFNLNPSLSTQLVSLGALSFSLPVLNLKSGEKQLDKNAYKALKTDRYKNIVYNLKSSKVVPGKSTKHLVKTQGDLTVAGVTKSIAMDVYCTVNPDASITCTGSEKLKMTDYQVAPPKFMAGAMKTGDNITLDFTIVYKK